MKIVEEGKHYPKLTSSKTIIRFQDCDPLRHLNNARYFDYFYNAREDQVSLLYGFSPADIFKEHGTGWVVYHHQIAYIRPAMVGEWVKIMSAIVFYDQDTIGVEYSMANEAGTDLKTLLWTTMKYVDANTGKKRPHQTHVMEYLEAVCLEGVSYGPGVFDNRIKQVKQALKLGETV